MNTKDGNEALDGSCGLKQVVVFQYDNEDVAVPEKKS